MFQTSVSFLLETSQPGLPESRKPSLLSPTFHFITLLPPGLKPKKEASQKWSPVPLLSFFTTLQNEVKSLLSAQM